MSEIQVASRYAKSLIDLAEEQNSLEAIKTDIAAFIQICKENSQFLAVLRNPIISPDKKIGILNSLFAGKVNPMILAFFKIMVNKGRSGVLYPTAKEFVNEYNKRKGIVNATVISATSLSDENKSQLVQVIKEATSADEIILETQVNSELIGGFVLRVGDRQFDASIANRLQKLKKEFAQKVVL